MSPLLAPSLMPAISLVYLFGNQGLLKSWLDGGSVYGFWGVVLGEAFYTFPHALLILLTALSASDARLYEAGRALGAGALRRFLTITLPGARYGLASAGLVVFTLVITDFGVPKVVGGDYNVLAVEAFKQVVGQQHFPRARGGGADAAAAGGVFLLYRAAHGAPPAGGAGGARGAVFAGARAMARRGRRAVVGDDLGASVGLAGRGRRGFLHQILALRLKPDAGALPVRQCGRRRLERLFQ
ncbi:ABC transporter permease subunit [Chromobacterium haemolyticum]|nr:ABC transporter permease subunit [Chromobacterium haemolyticum]